VEQQLHVAGIRSLDVAGEVPQKVASQDLGQGCKLEERQPEATPLGGQVRRQKPPRRPLRPRRGQDPFPLRRPLARGQELPLERRQILLDQGVEGRSQLGRAEGEREVHGSSLPRAHRNPPRAYP
jgi:hypothetical protein